MEWKKYLKSVKERQNRCREWMAVGHRAAWTVFGVFAALFLCQTVAFDHFAFRDLPMYTSWGNVFALIFCKIAAAFLFASLAFLMHNKRWMIFVSVLIDAWVIANLIYMRNNHIVLDAEAFNMSANLNGYFWSVLIYLEYHIDLLFVLMTALCSTIFFYIPKKTERSWKGWVIVLLVSVALRQTSEAIYVDDIKKHRAEVEFEFEPFMREGREAVYGIHYPQTIANTSVLYSPFYIVTDYYLMINHIQPYRPMSMQDSLMMQQLAPQYTPESVQDSLESPLIIVLLESLENWVVTPEIMPNLYRFTQNDHVFYANRIHTQIVGAPSADGQMIVNTGLLPINAGATCLHYPTNEFPAIMKLAKDSAICLLPHDLKVWNQTQMSPAYGYDSTICYCDIDTILFEKLNSLVDDGYHYIQCITQSTHSPFLNQKYSNLEVPVSMGWVMKYFIRGFNALDDGVAHFIRKIETDSVLQQYTIVITGDHRILHNEKRWSMQSYADYWRIPNSPFAWVGRLTPVDDCLPLIIYSPKITGNPRYTEDAYQMDIYPTYKALLGEGAYFWNGFGINLMDSTQKRAIQEKDAFLLSDKVIRNNYFHR